MKKEGKKTVETKHWLKKSILDLTKADFVDSMIYANLFLTIKFLVLK